MNDNQKLTVGCKAHGTRTAAVVCGHMLAATTRCVGFVENSSDSDDLQAWCDECESLFLQEDGITAAFEEFNDRRIVCDLCYQALRERHSRANEPVRCAVCGKTHPAEDSELAFRLPDVIHQLSEDERNERCHIGPEVCTLDRERFFLRGLIPIPVSGRLEPYNMGVWGELSPETYRRVYERWNDPDQRDEPRLRGTLANNVPLLDTDTLGVEISIQLIGKQSRPEFYVEVDGHPLKQEQTQGIDEHRAIQYSTIG